MVQPGRALTRTLTPTLTLTLTLTRCNLGELTGDEEAFHTAWRLSARGVATHTCARAKLSLGAAAMKRDAWDEARTHNPTPTPKTNPNPSPYPNSNP